MNLEHIAQFIDFVNSPEKYAAKLKELQDYESSIKNTLAISASASELEVLKSEQLATNIAAKVKLEEASNYAASKIASAEAYYKTKIEELNKYEEQLTSKAIDIDSKVKVSAENLVAVESSKKNLKNKEEQLREWELRVIAKEKELDLRLEKLKSVMV